MSDIINQNTEPLFIFDMPDDEVLSQTISVQGEKGERGDPTKTSQLINDSDFTTNAALTAGLATKADNSAYQATASQVAANTEAIEGLQASNIKINGENCQDGRWYKLVDFLATSSTSNLTSVRISGRLGGVPSGTVELVDIIIANRQNGIKAYGDFFAASAADYRGDLKVYQNADTTSSLYLYLRNWATVDLDVFCNATNTPLAYDGTYVTTEPSGELVWALSTDPSIQKNIDGTISADIDGDAATVNGHTVDEDVPTGAVFTDTIYDDTSIRSEIDAKADASDVAANYATKRELQSVTNGTPLVADSISDMTDTTKVYVLTTDGHWYYYNGSTWADGGVYQATEVADNSVSPIKTTFNKRTTNLFNKYDYDTIAGYPNGESILINSSTAASKSIVMPCEPNTTYVVRKNRGTRFRLACTSAYPQNGTACTNYVAQDGTNTCTYTTSSTASYLVFFFLNTNADPTATETEVADTVMISEGSTQNYYEPYAWLDINDLLEDGKISFNKLKNSFLNAYQGGLSVDFNARKVKLNAVNALIDEDLNKIYTLNSTLANGEYTIPNTTGLYVLSATVSGNTVSSVQIETYNSRVATNKIILIIDQSHKCYTSYYDYGGRINAAPRVAELYKGSIKVNFSRNKVKFSTGTAFMYPQANGAMAACYYYYEGFTRSIDIPTTSGVHALTATISGNTITSLQFEKYNTIKPTNYVILYVEGGYAINRSWCAPYNCGDRIKGSEIRPCMISLGMFNSIGAIGDSYTQGAMYMDGHWYESPNRKLSYIGVLGRKNGVDWANYGVGGSTTRSWQTSPNGLAKVLNSDKNDFYFLALGINDANQLGTSYLGTIADITDDYTQNPDTFYGNYARIIERVKEYAPKAKFMMVGCMRPDSLNPAYGVFTAAIEEIAEHYGIPFADPYDDGFFQSQTMDTLSNGHPTSAGYTGIALALERLFSQCAEDNVNYYLNANEESNTITG